MLAPVAPAPPRYALASPRPDLGQVAGSLVAGAAGVIAPPATAPAPVITRELLTTLIEEFEAAEDASRTNREKAERDSDYYDGKQYTEDEARKLARRGQPPIALNLIRQKIDYLQGLERTQRTKPRGLPRTPRHEQDAQAVGDALQFVSQDNRYDQLRSRVWKDLLVVGWGGVETAVEPVERASPGAPAMRVVHRRCPWDRMWFDPYSSEDDFSDASHLGMVLWMDREEAVRTWGDDAGKVFDETVSIAQSGGTYDDKPKVTTWYMAGKRKRVRIVQVYRLGPDGEWEFWEFTKGGILGGGPSPWLDEKGRRVHPYDWASAYVDRDNNRYGVVRDMIDPQDETNKRRSKLLHLFTMRQTFGSPDVEGAMSIADMRRELARPDGHIRLPPGTEWGKDFGIIPTTDMANGHLELLSQVQSVFETMGPNASMQGKARQAQSGRAVLANQQGGAIQMGTLTDTLRDMDYRVYRRAWNAIRQFWTGETWVRVTDDERNLRWVGLNTPAEEPVMQPVMGPQGPAMQPILDPATGQPMMQPAIDPATGMPVMQNSVADLDVDIIIDDAPEVGTMLDEQFGLLVELKKMDVNGELPFKALIEAAPNLRNKHKMLEAMEQREAQPDPIKLAADKAQLDNKQADTTKKLADAEHASALAARETMGAVHEHADRLVAVRTGGVVPFAPQPQAA